MADTDSLAQQALTVIASSRSHAERAPGQHISVFLTKDQADALIAHARSLESQLAESQQENETLKARKCRACHYDHHNECEGDRCACICFP